MLNYNSDTDITKQNGTNVQNQSITSSISSSNISSSNISYSSLFGALCDWLCPSKHDDLDIFSDDATTPFQAYKETHNIK